MNFSVASRASHQAYSIQLSYDLSLNECHQDENLSFHILKENRILTDLRNRLPTEYLEQLMRISIKGPADLDNDLKDLIIGC
jgi:hypothetical protein